MWSSGGREGEYRSQDWSVPNEIWIEHQVAESDWVALATKLDPEYVVCSPSAKETWQPFHSRRSKELRTCVRLTVESNHNANMFVPALP